MAKKAHLRKFIRKDKTVVVEYYPDKVRIDVDTTAVNNQFFQNKIIPEINLEVDNMSSTSYNEVKVPTNSQKMALFASMYRRFTGQSYTPTKTDVKKFDGIPITEKLLKAYFSANEWWNKNKNVMNYVHNINNVKQLVAGVSSKYPNEYDAKFEKSLQPDELSGYWKHLHKLGYKPTVKNGIRKWEKESK